MQLREPNKRGDMRRWKKHVANLNRILKDTTLPGSRRILAQVLAMWMDAEGEDKKVLTMILLGTYGPSGRGIKWADTDESDPAKDDQTTVRDMHARNHIKSVFAQILGEELESECKSSTDSTLAATKSISA